MSQPMTAARFATIIATAQGRGMSEADADALTDFAGSTMRELLNAWDGATRTDAMRDLLKEWGSL